VAPAAPFGFIKVIFLSHVIDENTPVVPGDAPVKIHPATTIQRDGYYLLSLAAGERAGTHWAAPGVGTTSRSQLRTVQLSEWVAVSPRVPEYGGSRFWLPCRRCMTMLSLAHGFHNEATRRIAVSPS
jgi:hypothetical protein